MKYYGDISPDHLELVRELQSLEDLVDNKIKDFPLLSLSKGFVCMSHDYYCMEMEEEGERLLLKAEKTCPQYFKGPIYAQMEKDVEFYVLVRQLEETLAFEVLTSLGFNREQV